MRCFSSKILVVLVAVLGFCAPTVAAGIPLERPIAWQGWLILRERGRLFYGLNVLRRPPDIKTLQTEQNEQILDIAFDETAQVQIAVIGRDKHFELRTSTSGEISTNFEIPVDVGTILSEKHRLFAAGGRVYLVGSYRVAEFADGKWSTWSAVLPQEKLPVWAAHVQDILLVSGQLVYVCDYGEWGSGLLSLNLKTRQLLKLYESNQHEQILSVRAAKDQVFILTDKAFKQVTRNLKLVLPVLKTSTRCEHWPVQIYVQKSGLLYWIDSSTNIFRLQNRRADYVATLRRYVDEDEAAEKVLNGDQMRLRARWLWIEDGIVVVQWFDSTLSLFDLETNENFPQVEIGEKSLQFPILESN